MEKRYRIGRHSPINIWDDELNCQIAMAINPQSAMLIVDALNFRINQLKANNRVPIKDSENGN